MGFRMRRPTPVKNFRISAQGVFQVFKTAKMGTVDGGMLVSEVQLKWHNCGLWESFWGLVALLYDNFCKTGNYVIYDVIIWVQYGLSLIHI